MGTPTPAADSLDAFVLRRASTQFHVVSVRQMRAAGCDGSWIWRRRRSGFLADVLPGVVAVGVDPRELTTEAWSMAATLRPRCTAKLSHESAAAASGIWSRARPDEIHVATAGRSSVVMPPLARSPLTIVTHRTTHDLGTMPGCAVPTTGITRTLIDVGTTNEPLQVTAMIREAVYRRLLLRDELVSALTVESGAPGTRTVRDALAWFDQGSAGTRSRSEDEFVRLVIAAGIPHSMVNVAGATGLSDLEVDFVWSERRHAVELDGGHHSQLPGARAVDDARDRRLREAGWTVDRIPAIDVWRRPRAVIRRVMHGLGLP